LKLIGCCRIREIRKSPPARGRGLKLLVPQLIGVLGPSPPARGRGLKHAHYLHSAQ